MIRQDNIWQSNNKFFVHQVFIKNLRFCQNLFHCATDWLLTRKIVDGYHFDKISCLMKAFEEYSILKGRKGKISLIGRENLQYLVLVVKDKKISLYKTCFNICSKSAFLRRTAPWHTWNCGQKFINIWYIKNVAHALIFTSLLNRKIVGKITNL